MDQVKAHPFFSDYSYDTKWSTLFNQRSPLEMKTELSSRPELSDDEVQF